MQSVSSRFWTRVAVSISYDDNHYTAGTSCFVVSQLFSVARHPIRNLRIFMSDQQQPAVTHLILGILRVYITSVYILRYRKKSFALYEWRPLIPLPKCSKPLGDGSINIWTRNNSNLTEFFKSKEKAESSDGTLKKEKKKKDSSKIVLFLFTGYQLIFCLFFQEISSLSKI